MLLGVETWATVVENWGQISPFFTLPRWLQATHCIEATDAPEEAGIAGTTQDTPVWCRTYKSGSQWNLLPNWTLQSKQYKVHNHITRDHSPQFSQDHVILSHAMIFFVVQQKWNGPSHGNYAFPWNLSNFWKFTPKHMLFNSSVPATHQKSNQYFISQVFVHASWPLLTSSLVMCNI